MASLWELPRPPGPELPARATQAEEPLWGLDALVPPPGLGGAPTACSSGGARAATVDRGFGSCTGIFAEFRLRHLAEPLRHRHLQLWAEVLPAVQRHSHQGVRALLAALANSQAFRDLFTGPRRQPFLLPYLPFVHELLSLPEVARGLASNSWPEGCCPYSSALFVYHGQQVKAAMPLPAVDSEELLCECLRYGTVMVMHSGNHWRKLGDLALASVEHLQIPTNNTIFLTDGGRQHSLNVHTDNHNVLILQTLGSKNWRVWSPTKRKLGPDPLARGKHHDNIDPEELGEVLLEVELLPGQALMVPLGFPHLTDTLGSPGEPSLHVTLSMYPSPTFAGLRRELLVRLGAPEVLMEEDLSDDVYWRLMTFLPVGCLAQPELREASMPGCALGALVVEKLCQLVASAEPARFWEQDPRLRSAAHQVVAANLRGLLQTLEGYARGFQQVARADGEFPTVQPRELTAAFGCGVVPRERERVDPEDGVARTKSQVLERYQERYRAEDIEAYWRDACRPVLGEADGEPVRIDPADGACRTLSELRHVRRFSMTSGQIEEYWRDACIKIHTGDTLPPEQVDRADRANTNTRELLALLEDRMPALKFGSGGNLQLPGAPAGFGLFQDSNAYELVD